MQHSERIAHVDLCGRNVENESLTPDTLRKWGGGLGLASIRLYREVTPATDPLGPQNVIWVIGGPLTGTVAPTSGRIEVVTKSALNGLLGHSNSGGMFGARLRHAGLGGLVLRGVAEKPVYLLVTARGVEFRDARHLWGKDIWETEKIIGTELDDAGLKRIKIMAIGPAGENLVRFACPINERYHAAARGGAGAVFGSKKVKAIVIDTPAAAPLLSSKFEAAARRASRKIAQHKLCRSYMRHASTPCADQWADIGCFAGRNYQSGVLPRWKDSRGGAKMMSYVTRPRGGCYRCPVPCFNEVGITQGKHRGLKISSGTFVQTVADFGAKCAIESLPAIWKCKQICHQLGMDMDSASGVVAFGMELFERGLVGSSDVEGLPLNWGNDDATVELLHRIAHRQGIGDLLAEGSWRASRRLGPATHPYVMTVKGMEMISSDVRAAPRGWSVGSLTNPRGGDNVPGTHMRGDDIPVLDMLRPENEARLAAYSRELVASMDMFEDVKRKIYGDPPRVDPFTYRGKAPLAKWFEDLLGAVTALGLCTFPADKLAIGPTTYADLFSFYLEQSVDPEEFMRIGERIFNIQRAFITREGIKRRDDTWPARFFEQRLPPGPLQGGVVVEKESVDRYLDEYYDARGWHRETGVPTPQTLERLDLKAETEKQFFETGSKPDGVEWRPDNVSLQRW